MTAPVYIDHSVYPDIAPEDLPEQFDSDEDRAEYVERICGAMDFDVFPEPATFELFSKWRAVFDKYPLPASPASHTMRS